MMPIYCYSDQEKDWKYNSKLYFHVFKWEHPKGGKNKKLLSNTEGISPVSLQDKGKDFILLYYFILL